VGDVPKKTAACNIVFFLGKFYIIIYDTVSVGSPEHEKTMQIELLYLIPIVALALFVLFFIMRKTPESGTEPVGSEKKPMGDTKFLAAQRSTEERLSEFESTITSINKAINDQQAVIGKYQTENSTYNEEIEKLRSKLRDLHKEYDIVISENYSLRAKVKSIEKKNTAPDQEAPRSQDTPEEGFTPAVREHSEMNMNLYEDTRLFKSSTLDDTREFDLTDLK
jgi:regulator of replication initiation timing